MNAADKTPADPRLETVLAGIKLRTPVLTASGTCGYGPEYADVLDYRQLGGFTTKSVTLHERAGNEPQRIVEVRAGILNAIGLANVGLRRFIAEKIPFIREMPTQVFVNVAGNSLEEYVEVAAALDEHDCIAGIELNVSCPNVRDGLMFGTDARLLRRLVEAVRAAVTRRRLIVKLSPNVADIAETARAAVDGGAHALSLINTYVGLSIDVDTWKPSLANVTGGLSGPAIRPLALYNVHRVYRAVARDANIPIIGMGGIQNTRDAIEFFLAGASAVAVGTALFVDLTAPLKIADGLAAYLEQRGLRQISELTGGLKLRDYAASGEDRCETGRTEAVHILASSHLALGAQRMIIEAVVMNDEWVTPSGKQLRDGESVKLKAYHASGRDDKSSVYSQGINRPVMGPARYSGVCPESVADYGPEVDQLTITLQSPLIISSEERLAELSPNKTLPGTCDEFDASAKRIRAYMKEHNHDGIVVNVGAGETNRQGGRTKRIRAMFRHSQVIDCFVDE